MNEQKRVILTGIKPTGTPHIANYFGAIKPAIELSSSTENYKCFYFIADYHALTTVSSAEELKNNIYEVASTWLACGLNPEEVVLYKQSDIPEIFELYTILTNLTPKGLMNRAHAYKAIVDENIANNIDQDANVNMGLYNYPILMASDILLFNANKVPVGLDQKQHIEIARDIATYFNNKYGKTLELPEGIISENVSVITGLDGRKMSKSYKNTIELFSTEEKLKKTISKIVTDSKGVNEPKDINNPIYNLYKLFATEQELKIFATELSKGISWAEAKTNLFEKTNNALSPMREKYNYYINNTKIIDEILKNGAQKARTVAIQTLKSVKIAIGVTN